MAKEPVKLSLRDMYAIKHALEKRVEDREKHLNGNGYTLAGRLRAEKDQKHEKTLIKRFEREIAWVKVKDII